MQKVGKLNFKIVNNNTELGNSRIEFNLSGSNMNYIVANTIRRIIFNDIPIYVFDEFKFDKNTSVFHNNYLKLRLRNMPIWSIENNVDYLDVSKLKKPNNYEIEETQEENQDDENNIELEVEKTLNSSSLKQLTMYVNYKNKSSDIYTVTTNDAKFYYDEKQISSPYKNGIPIVKLQPNQEIAFNAITKIGMENYDAMYSAVSVNYYKQNNENDFTFVIESRGQISEKRILQVALINIERRLKSFLKLVNDDMKVEETKEQGMIIVNNEDHTLGNLITRGLQTHDKISFAGYNLPHPLASKVHFHYKLKSGNIINILEDVIEYYSELFKAIEKQIETI